MENLNQILADALAAVAASENEAGLDEVRVQYLGKKGALTSLLKQLGNVAPEDRPKFGQLVNEAKQQVQEKMNERKTALAAAALNAKLATETIDISLSGKVKKSVVYTRLLALWNELKTSSVVLV